MKYLLEDVKRPTYSDYGIHPTAQKIAFFQGQQSILSLLVDGDIDETIHAWIDSEETSNWENDEETTEDNRILVREIFTGRGKPFSEWLKEQKK